MKTIIAILLFFILGFTVAGTSNPVLAVGETEEDTQVIFNPEITIPGSEFIAGTDVPVEGTTIGEWISAVYAFLAGVMGIIAALMVMWGGIKWLTASGNTSRISDAKDTIYSAIIALVLTFGSYIILRTINPSLVQINDLTDLIRPIATIEQVGSIPRRISEALIGNAGLSSEKNQANAQACPTVEEMRNGFEVFLTGYYKPAFPGISGLDLPSGGYRNFACNVGMQCDCMRNKNPQQLCQAGGLTWRPCDLAKEGLEKYEQGKYCNKTKSGAPPVFDQTDYAPSTVAASECFGFGTLLRLDRTGDEGPTFRFPWIVMDRGPDIKGRHMDLYMGEGDEARARAVNVTGRATAIIDKYCPPEGGECQALTQEDDRF